MYFVCEFSFSTESSFETELSAIDEDKRKHAISLKEEFKSRPDSSLSLALGSLQDFKGVP
jgi:hypothetical protein